MLPLNFECGCRQPRSASLENCELYGGGRGLSLSIRCGCGGGWAVCCGCVLRSDCCGAFVWSRCGLASRLLKWC